MLHWTGLRVRRLSTRSVPRRRLWAAATLVLLSSACGGPSSGSAAPATASALTTSSPSSSSDGLEGAFDLPRSVGYAGTRWTIETFQSEPAGDGSIVDLGVTVENGLDDVSFAFPAGLVSLVLGDAISVTATSFADGQDRLELSPESSVETTIRFELDGSVDLSEVTFEIRERDREPALLPLAGEIPPEYPQELSIDGTTHLAGTDYNPVRVEPLSVEIDLDDGRDRVSEGQRFVRFLIRVTGTSDSLGGSVVNHQMFRLIEDGIPRSPRNVEGGGAVGADDAIDVVVLFEIDAGWEAIVFRAGRDDMEQATWEVAEAS